MELYISLPLSIFIIVSAYFLSSYALTAIALFFSAFSLAFSPGLPPNAVVIYNAYFLFLMVLCLTLAIYRCRNV